MIAAASVLSWTLAFQGVPDMLVGFMKSLTNSPTAFLLLVIAMLLVLGMFLESISVLIVVVPLLMPVVAQLGIDPIHFGVVCTVATVIGLVTPPVGRACTSRWSQPTSAWARCFAPRSHFSPPCWPAWC
jgi:TRAP-type C4-dicarboxylate transport system permease large subunit